jgi:hypothetical protein
LNRPPRRFAPPLLTKAVLSKLDSDSCEKKRKSLAIFNSLEELQNDTS